MIIRIFALSFGFTSALAVACWLFHANLLISGVLSGGVLSSLNFAAIVVLVRKMALPSGGRSKIFWGFLFMGKLLVLGVILYLLIVKFRISGPGLILGITAGLISMGIAGLISGLPLSGKKE
jgi:hypothetical protein